MNKGNAIDECARFYFGCDDLVVAVNHAAVYGVVIWESWGVLVGWCSTELPDVWVVFYAGGELARLMDRAVEEDERAKAAHYVAWNRAKKGEKFRVYSKARLKNKLMNKKK